MATTGLFRPHILVSRAAANSLSPDQFDAAVRHERAHWTSRDNLKRLFQLATPEPLPFVHGAARCWIANGPVSPNSPPTIAPPQAMRTAASRSRKRWCNSRARARPPEIPLATQPDRRFARFGRSRGAPVGRHSPRRSAVRRTWKTASLIAASVLCCAAIANPVKSRLSAQPSGAFFPVVLRVNPIFLKGRI